VRDVNGNEDLRSISFLIGDSSNFLRLTYDAKTDNLSIAGPGFTSPGVAPGTSQILTGPTGSLDCQNTVVTRNGNDLSIAWSIKSFPEPTLKLLLRLQAIDSQNVYSPLLSFGTWRFGLPSAPTLVSMVGPDGSTANVSGSPATVSPLLQGFSATNEFVNFSTTVRDNNGAGDLSTVLFVLGTSTGELRLTYNAAKNLVSVTGRSGTSPSVAPGTANVLSVSSGALDCAATSVTRSGTDLTVNWRLKITSASTLKQGLRLLAKDQDLKSSPTLTFGTWTFSPPAASAASAATQTGASSAGES
jgi:hypothetical protein